MNFKLNKWLMVVLTFVVATIVLFYFYGHVLWSPNDYVFAGNGDGIKNYYTYLYHARYDDSFSTFTGMNYPYQEHIVYTDAHPLLSWLVGSLGLTFYGIGIINLLMLFSYPVAAVILYAIFNHYRVNNWWGLFASVCIAFLSPQVYRLTGHLSLSYVFAIPLMWWLLIKCFNAAKNSWSILIGFYMLAFFFTHPYLGIIMAFFCVLFWVVCGVAKQLNWKIALLNIGSQIIIPFALFRGSIALTDTHLNRLSNPAGFFDLYASWKSLLVAHDGPLSGIYSRFQVNIGNWESWCYIGFPTIIFALVIGVYIIRQRREVQFKTLLKSELFLFLIAAYLILLFAFCFPLKYNWLRWITDLFGPLKQFRVLGRFTWVFYYVFMVACTVGIYRLYKKQENKLIMTLFFGGIVFYSLEFYPVHNRVSESISATPNPFKQENLNKNLVDLIEEVDQRDYDAILFLPFQHMSSENVMILGAEQANCDAFMLSYHTNIPLINSISSRMSLDEAVKANNYFSPAFVEKELTYDFPEDIKIAVIKNRDLLDINELRMIWESSTAYENEEFVLFNFDYKKWNDSDRFEKIMTIEQESTINVGNNWLSNEPNCWYYYESFDSMNNRPDGAPVLSGNGSFYAEKEGCNVLAKFENEERLAEGAYSIRFWYNIKVDRPDVSAVVEIIFGEENAEWLVSADVKQSNLIVGDWALIDMEFEVPKDYQTINILLTGNGSRKLFAVDELLIQKQNDPPLFRRDELDDELYVVYNNYWLKVNSFQEK